MERLLVIGWSGLLGSRLTEAAKDGYEVYGTYNLHGITAENAFRLDVTNRESTFKLINRLKPDCVVHTHALNNRDLRPMQNIEEAWRVNVDGTRNVAEACNKFSDRSIYFCPPMTSLMGRSSGTRRRTSRTR